MLLLPEELMRQVVTVMLTSRPEKHSVIQVYEMAKQLEQLEVQEDKPTKVE